MVITTGGGGATTFNQYSIAIEKDGPTYTTGGFVVDLSATYSSLNSVRAMVKKGTRGNLGIGRFEYSLNSPTAGKVTIKVIKYQAVRVSSFGNVTNQPSGVTVLAASGGTSSSEAAHTHTANHDHASFATAAAGTGSGQVLLDALGPNFSTHTHTVDYPNLGVTTGAGSSHNHTDNTLYAHSHDLTYTDTTFTLTELPNSTNLTATTLFIRASGVRA